MYRSDYITTSDRPFDMRKIEEWCDKLDLEVKFHEVDAENQLESFRVEGGFLDVKVMDATMLHDTDEYVDAYLDDKISEYMCPFRETCEEEECTVRWSVGFTGCPWGMDDSYGTIGANPVGCGDLLESAEDYDSMEEELGL